MMTLKDSFSVALDLLLSGELLDFRDRSLHSLVDFIFTPRLVSRGRSQQRRFGHLP